MLCPARVHCHPVEAGGKPPGTLPDGFRFHGQLDRNLSGGVLRCGRLGFGRKFAVI